MSDPQFIFISSPRHNDRSKNSLYLQRLMHDPTYPSRHCLRRAGGYLFGTVIPIRFQALVSTALKGKNLTGVVLYLDNCSRIITFKEWFIEKYGYNPAKSARK